MLLLGNERAQRSCTWVDQARAASHGQKIAANTQARGKRDAYSNIQDTVRKARRDSRAGRAEDNLILLANT